MNTRRIMYIMTAIMLLVNIALSLLVVSAYYNKNYIKQSYFNDMRTIFENDGINIEDEAVDMKKIRGYVYSVELDENYYGDVAESISGENISTRFLIPGGYALTTESGKRFEFGDDFSFSYSKNDENMQHEVTEAYESTSFIKRKRAEAAVRKFLLADDENGYPAEIEILSVSYASDPEYYYIRAARTVDDILLYGHTLDIVLDGQLDVMSCGGKWVFTKNSVRYTSQVLDQVNILFIDKSHLPDGVEMTVASVKPYYSIFTNEQSGASLLVPSWEIEYSDGTVHIYDAQSGNTVHIDE